MVNLLKTTSLLSAYQSSHLKYEEAFDTEKAQSTNQFVPSKRKLSLEIMFNSQVKKNGNKTVAGRKVSI